jgi:DNA repair protein RadC
MRAGCIGIRSPVILTGSGNGASEAVNIRVVTIGLVDRSHVHPREVFADPLIDRASSVILAPNHPDGDLTPSREDVETTKRFRRAGERMGITVLDHIVSSRNGHWSFVERGITF